MKPPKEPKSFKYPRLYMRDIHLSKSNVAEAIIIYPDGSPAERTFVSLDANANCFGNNRKTVCWQADFWSRVFCPMTPEEQVRTMKAYALVMA